MRRLIRGTLRFLGLTLCCVFLLTAAVTLPLRWLNPPLSAFMLQRAVSAWWHGEHNSLRPIIMRNPWVDWPDISPHMALAAIAAEDQTFPQHWGFDFAQIATALKQHEDGKPLRGASTITQQVAKNLFLSHQPSWLRKVVEAYFTVLIELMWPKRRILEIYLNIAQFGPDTFGVKAASTRYFNTIPANLTSAQAALLAAVLPNPVVRQVTRPSRHLRQRQTWILRQMRQLGGTTYITF